MRQLRQLARTLLAPFHRATLDRELDEELRGFVEMVAEEKMRRGVDRDEAYRQARIELGGVTQVTERVRDLRPGARLQGLTQDIRFAARTLRRARGFTVVGILTLGVGIGAATAMFSAVHAVLLRGLPYRDAGEVVVLRQTDARDGTLAAGVSASNLDDLTGTVRTLASVGGADGPHGLRLVQDGRAISIRGWLVSEGFFETIGGRAHLGRLFLSEEFISGRDRVVILSHSTWQSRFSGDPAIVGRELVLDGATHKVVGVMQPDFKYPSVSEFWSPRPSNPADQALRARPIMDAVGRLVPGGSVAATQGELDRVALALAEKHPVANANLGLRVIRLREYLLGDVESPLMLLLGAVGLVLLIAAANVAGLELARGTARAREYALRVALGASSGRMLRLGIVESVLVGGAGAVLGIGLAYLGVYFIGILGPDHLARFHELRIDKTVLAFAVLAAVVSALAAGIIPALRAAKVAPQAALADGSRGSTVGPRASRLRDWLVGAEIAFALVLTIGAGLLVRSFYRLLDNELGFDPQHRLVAQVWAYDDEHQDRLDFFQRGKDEIAMLPGVTAVGLTTNPPLADDQSVMSRGLTVPFTIDGDPVPNPGEEPVAVLAGIDDSYPESMGIGIVAGRGFSIQDHALAPPVVMVNEAFARRHFTGRKVIGRRLTLNWRTSESRTIVGVLADVRPRGFESEPRPEVYVALSQESFNGLTFVMKTIANAASMTGAVQDALWEVDPSQATWAVRPMTELLWDWVRQRRFNTALLVAFAAIALCLAMIGISGLMAYSVEQRLGELGIRRALGGDTGDILWAVLRRGIAIAVAGVGLGLAGSFAVTRLLRGMLFAIDPFDPLTFAILSVFVVGVALFAAYLPARRAAHVDAMVALRLE